MTHSPKIVYSLGHCVNMETQHQQCPGLTQGSIEEKQSKIPNMKETEKGRY